MQANFDVGREFLKWIAVITMTIDHIGAVLYPACWFLRVIGRLSFPLFSFLLVLGVETTRNVKNYSLRLFIFALVSQFPFVLAIGIGIFESLNVFFTLFFGVLFIYFFKKKSPLILLPILASFLNFDYSIYGILLIGSMYLLREDRKTGIVSIILLNLLFLPVWPTQIFSLFALPIILFYSSDLKTFKGSEWKNAYPFWRKYFFYVYYPLHLTLLYLIKLSYFQ
ncbi:MAG: TraX family protein [Nitrososphaerota archaeon]